MELKKFLKILGKEILLGVIVTILAGVIFGYILYFIFINQGGAGNLSASIGAGLGAFLVFWLYFWIKWRKEKYKETHNL